MRNSTILSLALLLGGLLSNANAIEPIKEVDVKPTAAVFEAASRKAPLKITSTDDLAKYFGEEAVAKIKKSVDFEEQIILVFAWRGSGQDKLNYDVAESFPEQIFFRILPGRTRDLRPHTHVFALRSNVTWSMK